MSFVSDFRCVALSKPPTPTLNEATRVDDRGRVYPSYWASEIWSFFLRRVVVVFLLIIISARVLSASSLCIVLVLDRVTAGSISTMVNGKKTRKTERSLEYSPAVARHSSQCLVWCLQRRLPVKNILFCMLKFLGVVSSVLDWSKEP